VREWDGEFNSRVAVKTIENSFSLKSYLP